MRALDAYAKFAFAPERDWGMEDKMNPYAVRAELLTQPAVPQPQIPGLGARSLQLPFRGPGEFLVAPLGQRPRCPEIPDLENNIPNLALKESSARQNLAIVVKSAASLPKPSNRGTARPTLECHCHDEA